MEAASGGAKLRAGAIPGSDYIARWSAFLTTFLQIHKI